VMRVTLWSPKSKSAGEVPRQTVRCIRCEVECRRVSGAGLGPFALADHEVDLRPPL
jgi:hypothetical protein